MRTCLFVIDIQDEVATDPRTRIAKSAEVRRAGTTILAAARAARATISPIVFVQHHDPPGADSLQRGSDPWRLVFEPADGAVEEWLVEKSTRNTFAANPGLAQRLRAPGAEKIVAFGIQSECCVFETCKGGLEAGFQVTLLRGAHSTYDTAQRTATDIETEVETSLEAVGAEILPYEDFIRGLEQ